MKKIKTLLFLTIAYVFCLSFLISSVSFAVIPEQKKLLDKGIYYFDYACATVENRTAVSDEEANKATFPDLDTDAMATAINKFMQEENPNGRLNGLGETIVAGAENSNVSPFIIVSIGKKESGLGDPNFGDGFNVREANNSFGRSATSAQPHVRGAKLWYKWSSIKASVDHTAPENKNAGGGGDIAAYIREQYGQHIDGNNIEAFMHEYAPEGENDTAGYIESVKDWTARMVGMTEEAGATPTSKKTERLYMVGDSITVRAKEELRSELTQRGTKKVVIDGSVGRSITQPGQTRGYTTSGLEAVARGESDIRDSDTIVIALGTNQRDANFKKSIGDIVNKVKNINGSARIYWVNVFSKGGSNGYGRIDRNSINQDIQAQANNLNFEVIEADKTDIPLADSVHQTVPEGNVKFARLITNQVFEDVQEEDESSADGSCECGLSKNTTSGVLSPKVPEPWFTLIEEAGQHPDAKAAKVDPNLVATVLWVENRGWPDLNREWAVSHAAAAGPWQFIPSTWASLGRDGDGDGVKDPNNPKDAAVAAYLHHAGSAGKPIANNGYDESKSAEQNFQTVVLNRNDQNLLSFTAKYNGSGAPDGVKLANFSAGDENSDYVIMSYWLLATDFAFGYDPIARKKIDARSAGGSSVSAGPVGQNGCTSGTGAATGEFIWPLDKQYAVISCYGQRWGRLHAGIDIAAPAGVEIVAADGGTVVVAGWIGGYGNTVVIKHKNGLSTLYGHQKDGSIVVKNGDRVDQGQKIGEVNNSGASQGDHLHFNIQEFAGPDDTGSQDPLPHLPNDGRAISGTNCPSSLDQVER